MEKHFTQYSSWLQADLPQDLRLEAEAISEDKEEIYERFCRDLSFGTSGLRGKMGVGTNRINQIVIERATMGVADYLLSKHEHPLVVIGYDTRINSKQYAETVARVFADRGIDSYIFREPTPVPVVSFAIRHLKTNGGIMITASHNPKVYNGYKVYDHFGNQIDNNKARLVEGYIDKRIYFEKAESKGDACGFVKICDDSVREAYLEAVKAQILPYTEDEETLKKDLGNLSVVYTPLNGAGRDYAIRVFENLGVTKVLPVREQWEHDGNFPTCPSPNPEYEKTFNVAFNRYADSDTDIIIATDPDSDRMGVMARKDGKLQKLTGDQVGVLMMDYVCHCHAKGIRGKNLQGSKVAYKSYVSSPFAEEIAKAYGVELRNVPTGFKNIALEMELLKDAGREEDFLFGYEESLGYLYGNYTRDKDGILALQMVCLMAAALKARGMSLFDKLEELYCRHGFAESKAVSIEFATEKDREKIAHIMEELLKGKLATILGEAPATGGDIPEDMFRAILKPGHQLIIRPSGTELKLKIYAYAKGKTRQEASENLETIVKEVCNFIDGLK